MKRDRVIKLLYIFAVVCFFLFITIGVKDNSSLENSNQSETESDQTKASTLTLNDTLTTKYDSGFHSAVSYEISDHSSPLSDDYSSASIGEQNALGSAKSYLRSSSFSYKGLIEQLEYEGYTYSEAKYGADNCGADWYEQAEKTAKSYLKSSSFSYEGLIEQLEYEGFTNEEAVHGVDNCEADWYEQAVKTAESYLKYSSFSRSDLIDQLEYEGFTSDQAEYAVTQVGY